MLHRLQRDDAERLMDGRQHEHVRPRKCRVQLVRPRRQTTENRQAVGYAQHPGARHNLVTIPRSRHGTDQLHGDAGTRREEIHERELVLLVVDAREAQHTRRLREGTMRKLVRHYAVRQIADAFPGIAPRKRVLFRARDADEHGRPRERIKSKPQQAIQHATVPHRATQGREHLRTLPGRHDRRTAMQGQDGRYAKAFGEPDRAAGETAARVDVDHVRTERPHGAEEPERKRIAALSVKRIACGRREREIRVEVRERPRLLRPLRRLKRRRAEDARLVAAPPLLSDRRGDDRFRAAPLGAAVAADDVGDAHHAVSRNRFNAAVISPK